MIGSLTRYIDEFQLFTTDDNLLVGVSGGIDSVVLVDLLYRAGYAFSIAHCNFQLRGDESDDDEDFVLSLARRYDKPCYRKTFDTVGYAGEKGISVEMAARELRYQWFEEIRKNHHFDRIVVAHHLDDQVETFFLNLARGTGLSGLAGMQPVNGKVVRPLLFATRSRIEEYAAEQFLEYREDSSNALTLYKRNKIRHKIIPSMEEINPSFRAGMQETMQHLRDAHSIFTQAVESARERVLVRKSSRESVLILSELKMLVPMKTYLFEILKPFGFSGDVTEDMISCIDGQPGKQFFSAGYRAILDREFIIIQKIAEEGLQRYYLEESCRELLLPVHLTIQQKERAEIERLKTPRETVLVDFEKLQFPLIIRKWQQGDYFQPFGMRGIKKLSDFFVDEKFSLAKKERTWILTNGEEIVWVIGSRLDERYRITSSTRKVLVLELH